LKKLILLALLASLFFACDNNKRYEIGSTAYIHQMRNEVIIDCDMTLKEALAEVPEDCPEDIKKNLALVEVYYYSFDQRIHRGQLLTDYRHAGDIHYIFAKMLEHKFPLYHVIPINHSSYEWSDFETVPEGNTYSFHYRNIVFKNQLSYHGYGQAIDFKPNAQSI
jgi:hypothetical protein